MVIIVLLLAVILVPTCYFVVLPAFLQNKIDHPDTTTPPIINKINMKEMSAEQIRLDLNVELAKLSPFPVSAGFADMAVRIYAQDNELMTLNVPGMQFWVNEPIKISKEFKVNFNKENQANTHALVSKFSKDGLENFKVMVRFDLPLIVFGVQIYRGLPLHKEIIVGSVKPTLASIQGLMGSGSKDVSPPVMGKSASQTGAALRAKYDAADIYQATPDFPVVLSKAAIEIRDEGTSFIVGAAFENPTPIVMVPLEMIEFYLSVEGTNAVQFVFERVALTDGLQDFGLKLDINFIAPLIDITKVSTAIEVASKNYAETGGFALALIGPMQIKGADFLKAITTDLNIDLSVKELLKPSANVSTAAAGPLANVTSPEGIKSILGNSTISLQILAQQVITKANLVLPVIIPIPKAISFPYTTSISIYGGVEKAIQVDVAPVSIARTNKAITCDTSVVVVPVNSDVAATGLAAAINPALAAHPTASSIGIRNLEFALPGQKPFKWCTEIFGKETVKFGIPPICKECLLNSKAVSVGSSISVKQLATVRSIDVSQLTTTSGFSAKGIVDVNYPEGLPSLSVDIGFLHLDATVESVRLMAIELPSGLKFFPQVHGTNIDASAILARDGQVPGKVQKLADAILNDTPLPSYAGITGLAFGASSSNKIVTFSKIVVDVDSTAIKTALASSGSAKSSGSLLKAGMVKVRDIDISLNSATYAAISLGTVIENPIPTLTFSIGTISLEALLDDQTFVGLSISPIALGKGGSAVNIGLNMKLATGAGDLDKKVAKLVQAYLKKDSSISTSIGVTRLTISPPGISSGPAVIDQLSAIMINIPAAKLLQSSAAASSGPGPLDTSAIMPPSNIATMLNPSVKFVQMEAKSGGVLTAGGDVGYTNPLPISVKIPYFAITTVLAGRDAMTVEVSGMQVVRQAGTMQPRINLIFVKDPSIPDDVASLLNNFLAGRLDTRVGVKSIYFGTSASSRNDLLGAIDADLTSTAAAYASQGAAVKAKLDAIIDGLLSTLATGATPRAASSSIALLSVNGPLGIAIDINSADIAFQPSKVIAAAIAGNVAMPFPVQINVPYFSAGTGFDDLHFVDLNVNGMKIQGSGKQILALDNRIIFNDVDPVSTRIAVLADAFLHKKLVTGEVNAGRIFIGVSRTDNIDALSKVVMGVGLQKIFNALNQAPVASTTSTASLNDLVAKFGLKIENPILEALPAHRLFGSTSVGFSNPYPITLTGLGHVGLTSGLDNVNFVNIKIPGISLARGGNKLNAAASLEFPSSEAIRNKFEAFGVSIQDHFGDTPEYFVVSKFGFGLSEEDHIRVFEKAILGVRSSTILNQKTVDGILGGAAAANSTLAIGDYATLKSADIEFLPSNVINAAIKANVSLPTKVNIKLPYFAAGSAIDGVSFADLALRGLVISSTGANDLSLGTAISIHDSDALSGKVALIAKAYAYHEKFPGTIGGGKLHMGVDDSAENVIDTFSKFTLSLPLDPIAQKLLKSAAGAGDFDPSPIIKKLNLKLSDIVANTVPGRKIESRVRAMFSNAFPVTVKGLGYMAATAGVNGIPLVTLDSNGLLLSGGDNSVSLGANLYFPSSLQIQDALLGLLNHVSEQGAGNTAEIFTATGLGFGYDAENHFRFLSTAMLGISSSTVVNPKTIAYLKDQLGLNGNITIDPTALIGSVDVQKFHLDATRGLIVEAAAAIKNMSLNAQATIGYAALGAYVNEEE